MSPRIRKLLSWGLAIAVSASAASAGANPPGDSTLRQRIDAAGDLGAAVALCAVAIDDAIATGSGDSAVAVLKRASYTPSAFYDAPDAKPAFSAMLRARDPSPLPEPGRTRFRVHLLIRLGYGGELDEVQLGLTTILAQRGDLLDDGTRAGAHYMLAFCAYYLGDAIASARHAHLAGDAFLAAGDTLSAMESFDGTSTSYYRLGAVDSALYFGRIALSLSRVTPDTARVQNVYLNYAEALGASGRADSARYYLSVAERMVGQGEWALFARVQNAYATLYGLEGRLDDRIRALKAAVHYFELNEERHPAVDLTDSIAYAYAEAGDYRGAFRYRDRAAAGRDSLHAERLRKDTDAHLAALERDQLAREREATAHREAMAAAVLAAATVQRFAFAVAILVLCLVIAFGVWRMRARHRHSADLQRLVDERTRELTAQTEELRASNAELERFAYIASHDLKTPLRNVTSFVGLAQRRLPPEAQAAVGEYLSIAADNARHMHALVSDVLEYSRIGKAEADDAAEVSLAAVVAEVTRGMGADIAAAGATVAVDGDARATLPHTSLTQVITNLVENGLKYNRSEAPAVRVAIVDMGTAVRVAVTDNGIGIAPEYHERVFEVFRRLHTVDEYGGTGVGLSTCLKVVRQLGGDIALASEVGVGSTFTVTLPKCAPTRTPGGLTPKPEDALQNA